MKKTKKHRLENLGLRLVELQKRRLAIEKKEKQIAETLLRLMEKRNKKEITLEQKNRVIRIIRPVFFKVPVEKAFRLLSLKKFMQVVEVKIGALEKVIGRMKVEKIAEKREGKTFLRLEVLKKSIRS